MHAYLIIGSGTSEQVDKLLATYSISPINLLTLTPSPSHGIESIREIIHYLTLQTATKNENRGVFVQDAHLMTEPAQNAFLKTLEEPPQDTIIILTSPREDLLLPTILSRCVLITIASALQTPPNLEHEQELFEKLTKAGIGETIQFTESTGKTREQALAFVSGQLAFVHSNLHPKGVSTNLLGQLEIRSITNRRFDISQQSCVIRNLAKALLSAHSDLSRNVNPKMVIFELLKNY